MINYPKYNLACGCRAGNLNWPNQDSASGENFTVLARVVQSLDNAIHWINRYPVNKFQQNKPRYPLDSDLSGGERYPPFKQPGPGVKLKSLERH